ncbi:hypothetical protein [Chryseobacterium sp. G0201]|uniref:hypothetical protein n=1 Tax=Chryseobacterium sp. G0201 TaxID=2487065 RepID=UPI000F4E1DD8|nr:hypothetical protein [Chryseobacterium sp. G0201]AZA54978.1 hypothetical protein EG348_19235 [Chryseobacterium sp. G0201]
MKKILFSSILALSLISCSKVKSENDDLVENAAENTTSSIPIKRLKNTQTMLDAVYYEKIKNNESLKNLDKRFFSLQEDSRKIKDLYNDILSKSEEYYFDAEYQAKGIKDSTLRKEIINLVKNSSEKYEIKVKKLEEIKHQVDINYYKLYSFYNAFKIKKTLPEIEKYQNAHPLKTDSLNNFINKQNQLLNELKNLK